jgi:uroporphyrinogen decarboxylase
MHIMNTRERFLSVMAFEPGARTLLWEWGYWGGAIERWYAEGLPEKHGLREAAGFGDTVAGPGAAWRSGVLNIQRAEDVSDAVGFDGGRETIPLQNMIFPLFEEEIIAEEEEIVTVRASNGVVERRRKDGGSVPHTLSWPVSTRDDWEKLKAERFQIRIEERLPANWNELVREYKTRDYPLSIASGTCGFFGAPRTLMGDVNLFYAYYDQPDLLHDMLDFLTDFWIEIYGKALEDVGEVESAEFWEDMCYKNGPMISPAIFREFMMPYYKRLIGFLRDNGVRNFCVDTDGDCSSLIPLFLECGMTGMLPFEVQAGMDIVKVRRQYPQLQIYGGIDKLAIAEGKQAIDAELEYKLPPLLQQGGYIPFADHLVHPDISWENFQYYRKRVMELALEYGV